jgi:DNA recombination protein RmuC
VFLRDVKNHISDISEKYILPDEGTYDFALMYIPAENVYYETIIKDEEDGGLFPYASERRVIPVSPNSFFAYLQVIVRGLRGLQIEERAKEIMGHLDRLKEDERRFRDEYDVLGRHLSNASKKFEESTRRLNRFEDKLISIGSGDEILELSPGEE